MWPGRHHHGGGAQKDVNRQRIRTLVPRFLERYLWFFEAAIEDSVARLAAGQPAGARVLDAGAGESQHKKYFHHCLYTAVDLAVGDSGWDYTQLDVLCDLTALPFASSRFDACLNVVTLEHVRQPERVLRELGRTLRPGGRLVLVAPQDWEIHQAPNDYFRYTRHGIEYLLGQAGFTMIEVQPQGGYFRLMGRRMLNGIQFFSGLWAIPAALILLPAGMLFPLLDRLDQKRDFTLGYICTAVKGV